jgi:Domain of unknown function (DUF4037)
MSVESRNLDERVLDLTGEGLRDGLAIGASMARILRVTSPQPWAHDSHIRSMPHRERVDSRSWASSCGTAQAGIGCWAGDGIVTGMSGFVPGLELCRSFYEEVVAPAVGAPHGAALLGPGSDVLGYDTERSTDHDWGPRCQLFVQASDLDGARSRVLTSLPKAYQGWPLAIGRDGERLEPHVVIATLPAWLEGELGWDLGERELTAVDWLLIPQTRLLGITQGAVLVDPDGDLAHLRRRLAWFPDAVWWWLMARQWKRLSQEEPFVQRTAEVGDQLGAAVLAGRLVRDCMRLALLIGRKNAPYSKWLGTAFAGLPDPDGLGSSLAEAMAADTLTTREEALGRAYQLLGERFNTLSPGSRLDITLRPFHDRPALVLGGGCFAAASLERVDDPVLTRLPLVGAVDQLLDCTDVLAHPALTSGLWT